MKDIIREATKIAGTNATLTLPDHTILKGVKVVQGKHGEPWIRGITVDGISVTYEPYGKNRGFLHYDVEE